MIQQTSKEAYEKVKPQIANRCLEVYTALRMAGPMTNQEVADMLKRPINTITPRMNELVNRVDCFGKPDPLVEFEYKKVGSNGRSAMVWGLVKSRQMSFV